MFRWYYSQPSLTLCKGMSLGAFKGYIKDCLIFKALLQNQLEMPIICICQTMAEDHFQ